jgi:ribosomal protein S18 acetylase RimI-like enzyme
MTAAESDLTPKSITIRPATLDDAAAIAHVHIEARRAAYAHFFPREYLEGLTLETVTKLWQERLAEASVSLVAEAAGRVVGQIRFGPSESVPGAGEVLQLHVDPAVWRQAIGSRLMATAIEALARDGFTEAVLNVYKENDRGRRFYERLGWRFDDFTEDADRAGHLITQLRYRRSL